MKTPIYPILLSSLLISFQARAVSVPPVQVDHLEGTTVHFKAGQGAETPKALKLSFYEPVYIDSIQSEGKRGPYLLFSGRPCEKCSQEKALYLVRADGGEQTHFVYPGTIVDPKTRSVLLSSRAFYGKCLIGAESGYVVFQKERIERRHRIQMQSSVFIAEPGSDHLQERLLESRLPNMKTTLRLIKAKSCHEIEGRKRLMSMKAFDLRQGENDKENDSDKPDASEQDDDEEATE